MYTPHVVTIVNSYQDDMMRTKNYLTVLDGVFYDAAKGSNVRQSGLENADSVTLFIPFTVNAYDPISGARKFYIPARQYDALTDKQNYFTLSTDETCFFVKGVITEETASFKAINAKYDAHRITKVDEKDFGSKGMQHWEVGGA